MFQKAKALKHAPFPADAKINKTADCIYTAGYVDDLPELDIYSVGAPRVADAADMSYAGKDYLIRPVSCIHELIAEGERLHHCVGGYGERISDGKCMIFLLRRTDAPEEPFVTVEIRADGSIGQTSAAYNKPPKGDVMSFIRAWHARRFTTEDKPAKAG